MKFSFALFLTSQLVLSSNLVDAAEKLERRTKKEKKMNKPKKLTKLPEIFGLIDAAFPMWEVNEKGGRVEKKGCKVKSCEWNPYYITKRYDGDHPDKGGHPTDLDVKYAFYYASPFLGQPFPGTPHHCPIDSPNTVTNKDCPKLITLSDDGPYLAGHVPPHIALAALTW